MKNATLVIVLIALVSLNACQQMIGGNEVPQKVIEELKKLIETK